MAISQKDKQLLNDLAKSQPALNREGEPFPASAVAVGDMMASASSRACIKVTYNFAIHGGAISPDIVLGGSIPAGAIVTEVLAEVLTAATSGGTPAIDLKVGTTQVVTAADPLALSGISAMTVVLGKVAGDGKVRLDIDSATLTDGKIAFYISYINP